MTPRVSVIMAVYNGAKFLDNAISSVLEQSYSKFEFIIVDDASTDGTAQLLRDCNDNRVVILTNQSNQGLSKSLNRAISVSNGEYLARQDADDISLPERLTRQIAALDDDPKIGFVGTTSEWIDESGKSLGVWNQPTSNMGIQERLLVYCSIVHGSVMMRKSALNEIGGGYSEKFRTGQDHDLWLRMTEHWDAKSRESTLYKYRWHSDMASKQSKEEQKLNSDEALAIALERRNRIGRSLFLQRKNKRPSWMTRYSNKEWAQRMLWWSAGSREISRGHAARFLLFSLLLNPGSRESWQYIRGIGSRKLTMIKSKS